MAPVTGKPLAMEREWHSAPHCTISCAILVQSWQQLSALNVENVEYVSIGIESTAVMPPINACQLLRPPPPLDLQPRQVHVVCHFGAHDLVYSMCIRQLARIVNINFLQRAPPPTQWAIFHTKSHPLPQTVPMDEHYSPQALKGTGLVLMYETAGFYYNGKDATQELMNLPKRGGKKSTVIIKTDVDQDENDQVADSTDTEYDTDGEPKPKARKPPATRKTKPKRRRSQRRPHAENMAYREEVVRKQSEEKIEVFTLNELGEELCVVLAQLLRCFELTGSWEGAFAHFYTNADWLSKVGLQAIDSGNDTIAVAAVNALAEI